MTTALEVGLVLPGTKAVEAEFFAVQFAEGRRVTQDVLAETDPLSAHSSRFWNFCYTSQIYGSGRRCFF